MTRSTPMKRRSRSFAIVVVVVSVAAIAAACTPKGNPKGSLDVAYLDASNRVVVEGWSFDPETPGDVLIEAVEGPTVLASQRTGSPDRPDVAAAYPGQTSSAVGFAFSTPALGPGQHEICVWARNRGVGTGDTQLGCRTFGQPSTIDSFALLGDSLAVGVESPLRSRLTAAWPSSTLITRTSVGAPLSYAVQGIDLYRSNTDVLVVSSGVNNLLSTTIGADLRAALDSTAGARCVIWPTVSERIYQNPSYPPQYGTPQQWRAGALAFNQALRDEASIRPNVHLADWAPTVTATSGYTGVDGLHHTSAGNQAFADLLAATVASGCG